MKTKKFRLTLDVEFDPQGVGGVELRRHLLQVVRDAVNNGTLTGDTPATVEGYDFKVEEIWPECRKCGTILDEHNRCQDETCPYHDCGQDTEFPS